MMQFRVKVILVNGAVTALSIPARDETDALERLKACGHEVLSIETPKIRAFQVGAPKISIVLFCIELIALLDAGLNLTEAIQALASKGDAKGYEGVLPMLQASLRNGESFSNVLSQSPQHFPAIFCAVVKAAERSGDLRNALAKYVEYEEAFDDVRRKLSSALVYPAVLAIVGAFVMLFLMMYVVPRFAHLYDDKRGQRPFFSTMLKALGQFMEANGPWVLIVLLLLVGAITAALRHKQTRVWINKKAWQLPGIGARMRLFQLARLYRTLGMLLHSGIPIVAAIDMAKDVLAMHLQERLVEARGLILEGRSLSAALNSTQLVTPIALQMMQVGERGGRMAEMLERIASFCDEDLSRWLDRASRLFEPLLMLAIGISIGGVVVLMYMPIFELANSL